MAKSSSKTKISISDVLGAQVRWRKRKNSARAEFVQIAATGTYVVRNKLPPAIMILTAADAEVTMAKLSEALVTGNLAPWQTGLYQFLSPAERKTLNEAYELEQKAQQEAMMAKKAALKQQELDKEISRVIASLESPKLSFTIADLNEDPRNSQQELVDFLRRHTGDDISLVGSSRFGDAWRASPLSALPTSKMNFSAKVKWTLASMEVIEANGKFTAIVQVPIE